MTTLASHDIQMLAEYITGWCSNETKGRRDYGSMILGWMANHGDAFIETLTEAEMSAGTEADDARYESALRERGWE